MTCPGPLFWFDIAGDDDHDPAAVLECAACGYVVTTGNLHDDAHADTPLLREGIATA